MEALCSSVTVADWVLFFSFVPGQALAPYITQSIGIDLSEKMVAAYNTRARNQVSAK